MIYTKPFFYDNFKCKADKCTDSCCIGWEVDIDRDCYEKYKLVEGEFGKRLSVSIEKNDDQHCFKLAESDRCVFLAQDGLCDIYAQLGEEYLCEICREHPRFYDYFDNIIEMGLGLCCEKVCEMIFASDEPVTFVSYSDDDSNEINDEAELYFLIREKCFNIICDRKKSLYNRIYELISYGVSVQNELFSDEYVFEFNGDRNNIFRSVIRLFSETEPINDEWAKYIQAIGNESESILSVTNIINTKEYEYEQILTYILYRHFMQSRFSGNVLSAICFSVINIIFIYLCDCKTLLTAKTFFHSDRINNVKLWSKQIEYSEENTNLLIDNAIYALLNTGNIKKY